VCVVVVVPANVGNIIVSNKLNITTNEHLERFRHAVPAIEGNIIVGNNSNITINHHLESFRHVVPANHSKQLLQDRTPFKLSPTRQETRTHIYILKSTHTRMSLCA
jgi:hypothetical protein